MRQKTEFKLQRTSFRVPPFGVAFEDPQFVTNFKGHWVFQSVVIALPLAALCFFMIMSHPLVEIILTPQ